MQRTSYAGTLAIDLFGEADESKGDYREEAVAKQARARIQSLLNSEGAGANALFWRNALGAGTVHSLESPESDASSFPELTRRSPPPVVETFHALQEWEGYVVRIGPKEFEARLVDITAGGKIENEDATIPFSEISDFDREKVVLGSVFRWVIGFGRMPSGTKRRVSQIIFRDLPAVTESDVEMGRAWAEDVSRAFGLWPGSASLRVHMMSKSLSSDLDMARALRSTRGVGNGYWWTPA